jgi:hypothetical protein
MNKHQLAQLRRMYASIDRVDPFGKAYNGLCHTLDKASDSDLLALSRADIKFISSLALNRVIKRGLGFKVTP